MSCRSPASFTQRISRSLALAAPLGMSRSISRRHISPARCETPSECSKRELMADGYTCSVTPSCFSRRKRWKTSLFITDSSSGSHLMVPWTLQRISLIRLTAKIVIGARALCLRSARLMRPLWSAVRQHVYFIQSVRQSSPNYSRPQKESKLQRMSFHQPASDRAWRPEW